MEKKIMAIIGALLLGAVLVSASGYYSMHGMQGDGFEEMHAAMMAGDYEAAEEYHEALDFECPMHELVKSGDVSADDFRQMHGWMVSGDFPEKKPEGLSDSAWQVHKRHHP